MIQVKDATYRRVAITLVKHLPVQDDEFSVKVEEYLATIKRLPKTAKLALRSAYIFSQKAPKEERQDLFQELATAILDVGTTDEPLAYAIARRDWQDWWKHFKVRSHFKAGSLNQTVMDADNQEVELAELIVGEVDFEKRMDGKIDADRIWETLPEDIKPIVQRRLLGYPLNNTERSKLNRWIKREGYRLLLR